MHFAGKNRQGGRFTFRAKRTKKITPTFRKKFIAASAQYTTGGKGAASDTYLAAAEEREEDFIRKHRDKYGAAR